MSEKVRYERRLFYHTVPEGKFSPILMHTLEKICLDFGGFLGYKDFDRVSGWTFRDTRIYNVGKKNGEMSYVKLTADFSGSKPTRAVTVINVVNHAHEEFLVALHTFYQDKLDYDGIPKPVLLR